MLSFAEGKSHDASLLRESSISELLETNSNGVEGRPLCVYRDPAYPLRPHLQTPFKQKNLTEQQHEFNKAMSKVCPG